MPIPTLPAREFIRHQQRGLEFLSGDIDDYICPINPKLTKPPLRLLPDICPFLRNGGCSVNVGCVESHIQFNPRWLDIRSYYLWLELKMKTSPAVYLYVIKILWHFNLAEQCHNICRTLWWLAAPQ